MAGAALIGRSICPRGRTRPEPIHLVQADLQDALFAQALFKRQRKHEFLASCWVMVEQRVALRGRLPGCFAQTVAADGVAKRVAGSGRDVLASPVSVKGRVENGGSRGYARCSSHPALCWVFRLPRCKDAPALASLRAIAGSLTWKPGTPSGLAASAL